MSRGGRRRRGRRGRRGANVAERTEAHPAQPKERATPARGRRAPLQARRPESTEGSVLEQMSSRPTRLETLPPDGTVLEELIGAMQSEYGVPTTPQEYRLLIRTRTHEESTGDPVTDPGEPVVPDGPAGRTPVAGPDPRPNRRRARRRHREGTAPLKTEGSEEARTQGRSGAGAEPPDRPDGPNRSTG